jgi:hypothetical protein
VPERPLLFFPRPSSASKDKKGYLKSLDGHPSFKRQNERLSPQFKRLQETFLGIQDSAQGIDPEMTLVLEVVGSVSDLKKAAEKIKGLEFLGETEIENLEPNEDFCKKDKDGKPTGSSLKRRLYLLMTNHQALGELLSLWKKYCKGETEFEPGLKKFLDLFKLLNDIRLWDVKERLEETGLIENLEYKLKQEEPAEFEIELWFRRDLKRRGRSAEEVTALVEQDGGEILKQYVLEEIAYQSLLVRVKPKVAQEIISKQYTKLINFGDIMYLRPHGQMAVGEYETEESSLIIAEQTQNSSEPLLSNTPIIAVLDGMPLQNHQLLRGRLIVDDPDGYESLSLAKGRTHGTAMASLILHGDLNNKEKVLSCPIYIRPILLSVENHKGEIVHEEIPKKELIVDLIHRAVKRIVDGDGTEAPKAPSVKIINLSIGDRFRPFIHEMSPLARLLDWLSAKYNILFIVSAGNQDPIDLTTSFPTLEKMPPQERMKEIILKLYEDRRNRKLLSPAESINCITVGAVHSGNGQLDGTKGVLLDPYESSLLPSPYSTFGDGYRRAIKPDIVFPGGKQLYYRDRVTDRVKVVPDFRSGQKVACPGDAGDLGATKLIYGTSNAAALASRAAFRCYEYLTQLINDQPDEFWESLDGLDIEAVKVPLIKAMLVHGSMWGETQKILTDILDNKGGEDIKKDIKKWITKWLGYGMPDIERVLTCTPKRVTVIGFGALQPDGAHLFDLPLPSSLKEESRRLVVTLAWLSSVTTSVAQYRDAKLWFEVNYKGKRAKKSLELKRINADHAAVRRGTIQHEVFEGERMITDGDEDIEDILEIKVNCGKDAKDFEMVRYGLIVSLEVKEKVERSLFSDDIYNEVRDKLATQIKISHIIQQH